MKLLEIYKIGSLTLKNKIVMAPLTRSRSNSDGIPSDLNVEYYKQRASAGLIIAEATAISKNSLGYINAPSIYSQEHIKGWKKITDGVHKEGGIIFLQMFHVGRVTHSDFFDGELPIAPSSIKADGEVYTPQGKKNFETPRALELNEIPSVVQEFKIAAQNAKDAGFDGIEIHGANGYLINQFIDDISNNRTDIYGGSIENRSRFLFEVLDAVLEVWDSKRVGLRLSPSGIFHSVGDANARETYSTIIEKLNTYSLAYLHLMNPMMPIDQRPELEPDVAGFYGSKYKGTLMMNGHYTKDSGNELLEKNLADLVSYGSLFISNPDLPKRFELNTALNVPDQNTFYTGGKEGYTDYPFLNK
ncbi:alkene reductase [Maribacter sp. BPC-D8]|uniref:alkene reductase n=1 Tax=Maribacter sp. BPC-D8 TaxID=3053613 RepID=UPI002B45C096|nr:alkene reductase [Maribacter sp. BPC-D8]WRI30553.1 alkene reductase [Maribacter sp. BPC-D8]